jgi:hypothetical protein
MAKKYESKWNIEDLTDREICDAIRYLEPESRCEKKQNNDESAFVICFCVVILLLGFLGFMWLYSR